MSNELDNSFAKAYRALHAYARASALEDTEVRAIGSFLTFTSYGNNALSVYLSVWRKKRMNM